jgi:hypothetical protein
MCAPPVLPGSMLPDPVLPGPVLPDPALRDPAQDAVGAGGGHPRSAIRDP